LPVTIAFSTAKLIVYPPPPDSDWTEMSSSPFELFRRNLKPLMVFLTLLALVSFVILPSIAMYQQQRVGYGSAPSKLASYQGGDFDFNKVNFFTRNHFATTQFLRDLAEVTISRGGLPKVADFQYDSRQNMIQALGINSNPSDQSSVRTLMFAGEAKKAGLDLDDTAIRNWLTLYSDGRLSDSEINGVLSKSTRKQMGQVQLYEQLRTQLLAQAYQRQVMGALTSGGMPIVPPAQQWELFLRLNRRAVADAYAVNVADFIEKTEAKPSESQLKTVYEEGKLVFPDDQSPTPAFRRPYTANVEYLAGNLNDFIDREMATLTEVQLRAEYQKRLDGGEFKLPEMPAAETPAVTEIPATPATEPPAAEKPAQSESPEDSSDAKMLDEKPATPAEPTEAPAVEPTETPAMEPKANKSAEPAPAEPKADAEAAVSETNPATEAEPKPADADSSRVSPIDNGVRLVVMQAEDEKSAVTETTPAEEAAASVEKTAETPVVEPAKAEPAKTEPAKAEPAKTEAEVKPEALKAEETPEEMSKTEAVKTEAVKTEAPKVESYETVRDDIARSLAMPPALDKLDAAVSEVDKMMRTYFNARAIAGGKADKIPPRPNLKALADKLGMQHVVTGMKDLREIQNDPISLSFGVGTGMQRGDGFAQSIYTKQTPAFTPVRTVDDQAQVSYISWKTDEKDSYIPELKEVREDVITAIRTAEARKLAQVEAESWVSKFAKSDNPAKELIPEDRASLYFESLGPFSWMQSLGFGMRAFMGNVPELDRVGEAFMRQVFTSERNVWSVAPNMPETVYYVVRPFEFSPSTDELHQRFTQVSQRMQTMSLAVEEAIKIRDGHYEALDERTGFEWNEEALANQ